MFLDVLPFKNDTARLVRVYGDEPCITLPEALPAPEGGTLTITELGDYCFSEKPRGLPAPEELCRYAVEPDGTARLLRAFGRDLTGASHLDFGDGDASTAVRSGEEALHPLCGSFLEELVLPGSLRVIGSCAFYNCRRLRRLSAGAGELTMGSDVFLNCFALETLVIRARPEQATGLFALVACITEAVQALFWPEGEARTFCSTRFRGRGTITDSAFWMGNSSRSNTTPSSRRGTMRMTPTLWPCSALTVCAGPGA